MTERRPGAPYATLNLREPVSARITNYIHHLSHAGAVINALAIK